MQPDLSWLEWLSSPSATPTLFALWIRALGMMLAWACGMLVPQILALAGSRGIQPAQDRIARIRKDFDPAWMQLARFPSFLHVGGSWHPRNFDRLLQAGLIVGAVAGLCVACGVGDSRIGLGLAWIVYLSYTNMVQLLIYPWDYLLLEATFLSLFLPSTSALSSGAVPLPLVTFSLRWLLFRLMFGFGKIKFSGCSTKEFSYLKGFMINQPLCNYAGWTLHDQPLAVHKLGLAAFFVSEIIVPFGFVCASGNWRVAAAVGTMMLQANIQMAGNFGFFNLLSGLLCIPSMDGASNLLQDWSWTQLWAAPLTHLILGTLTLLSFFFLIFNSWCTMSFMHWPSLNLPRTTVGDFMRALSPFHVLHAYGIFFAHSSPAVRWVPIIEGSAEEVEDALLDGGAALTPEQRAKFDSISWEPFEYYYQSCSPCTRPPFVAPFHYRFDQAVFYDSVGMTPDTLFASLSSGNPYDFLGGNRTNLERVVQALLLDQTSGAGEVSPVEHLFKRNPFPSRSRPVRSLRISLYLYSPLSVAEMRAAATPKGGGRAKYWSIKYVGSQTHQRAFTRRSLTKLLCGGSGGVDGATRANPSVKSPTLYRLREPSAWHPEHYLWQTSTTLHARLTSMLAKHLAAAVSAATPSSLSWILTEEDVLPSGLYDRFWSEFLPALRTLQRRIIASTDCARDMMRAESSNGSSSIQQSESLTKRFLAAWSQSGSSLTPVLDWSSEMIVLERALCQRCSRSDMRAFQVVALRLVMLLQHQLLQTSSSGSSNSLYTKPGAEESSRQSEESEAHQLLEIERQEALCTKEGRAAVGQRLPAPTLAASFGLLPALRGGRSGLKSSEHLLLPSFFHLHMFAHHALVSCATDAELQAMLQQPRSTLGLQDGFSLCSGLLLFGAFDLPLLSFHAAKARLARCITFPQQREQGGLLPGFLQLQFDFLPFQFARQARDERLPLASEIQRPMKSDEWWRINTAQMHEPTVKLG